MRIDIPDELVGDTATALERLASIYRADEHHAPEDVEKLQAGADQLDLLAARILDQRDTLAERLRIAEAELQRRRAEQAAGREHVERVVREEFKAQCGLVFGASGTLEIAKMLARRVADRLSVPAGVDESQLKQLTDRVAIASRDGDVADLAAEAGKWKKRAQSMLHVVGDDLVGKLIRLLDERGHGSLDRELQDLLEKLRPAVCW